MSEVAAPKPNSSGHLDTAADVQEGRAGGAVGAVSDRAAGDRAADATLERAASHVRRRLVPFLFLLYIFAYLDRINVGFAALQMNAMVGLSAAAYGFGAGIFFFSYTAFEVPSNIILARVGARRWIARIMITWGLVSSAMMLTRGPLSFYALRFLLGLAEAGFFPGIIYYLTRWVPARERARVISLFSAAAPLGFAAGPLLAAWLIGGLGLTLAAPIAIAARTRQLLRVAQPPLAGRRTQPARPDRGREDGCQYDATPLRAPSRWWERRSRTARPRRRPGASALPPTPATPSSRASPPPWVTTANSGANPSTCSASFMMKLIGIRRGK